MYDVITAIDGDMAVNRCTADEYECLHPSVQQGNPLQAEPGVLRAEPADKGLYVGADVR